MKLSKQKATLIIAALLPIIIAVSGFTLYNVIFSCPSTGLPQACLYSPVVGALTVLGISYLLASVLGTLITLGLYFKGKLGGGLWQTVSLILLSFSIIVFVAYFLFHSYLYSNVTIFTLLEISFLAFPIGALINVVIYVRNKILEDKIGWIQTIAADLFVFSIVCLLLYLLIQFIVLRPSYP